jgi:hypothetical protein
VLPTFDPLNRQRHYFEVFNKGREAFGYRVETDSPWIVISSPNGIVDKEDRIWVSINWDRIPLGTRNGKITVHHSDLESVEIEVPLNNSERDLPDTFEGFVDSGGFVSIEAEHFTKQVPTEAARWKKIEGYGRTLSAMTIVPVTASSVRPPYGSPCLEYEMYLFTSGKLSVLSYFAPTLNFNPQHGLRYAVSIDDETPQILDIVPEGFDARNGNREWENSVRNSIRIIRSEHEVSSAGYHTLKVWMVDPAVVLEKIVVDLGGLNPSYLGPPESNARDAGADSRE